MIPGSSLVCFLNDGYAEGIMVPTGIVWAVHHYINFEDIRIKIAVNMVNVATL